MGGHCPRARTHCTLCQQNRGLQGTVESVRLPRPYPTRRQWPKAPSHPPPQDRTFPRRRMSLNPFGAAPGIPAGLRTSIPSASPGSSLGSPFASELRGSRGARGRTRDRARGQDRAGFGARGSVPGVRGPGPRVRPCCPALGR